LHWHRIENTPKERKKERLGEKKKHEKHLGGKLVVLVIRAGIR
jgi:hypothetical protein